MCMTMSTQSTYPPAGLAIDNWPLYVIQTANVHTVGTACQSPTSCPLASLRLACLPDNRIITSDTTAILVEHLPFGKQVRTPIRLVGGKWEIIA